MENSNIKDYTYCPWCNETWEFGYELNNHLKKEKHLLNYYLYLIEKRWKKKSKDRYGVSICISSKLNDFIYLENKGSVQVKIHPLKSVHLIFKIINNGDIDLLFENIVLINPVPYFHLTDNAGISSGDCCISIPPGASYTINVHFEVPFISSYLNVLAFNFSNEEHKDMFTILKRLVIDVNIEDDIHDMDKDNYISPYLEERWQKMNKTYYGYQKDGKRQIPQIKDYPIPNEFRQALKQGLQINTNTSYQEEDIICPLILASKGGPEEFERNYEKAMHALLYLEEYDALISINRYNMTNVSLQYLHDGLVSLMVPGLGENRPSLIVGDILYVRIRLDENTPQKIQYQGQICSIEESNVHIQGFIPEFLKKIKCGNFKFDVRFELSRLQLVRMHKAIDLIFEHELQNLIFPKAKTFLTLNVPENLRYYNPAVNNNPMQQSAIKNILAGSSRPNPYIIFGPPGTGKTVTLVEAILQIVGLNDNCRILASAPSNSACDVLASKLIKFLSKKEILRLHSTSRDWKTVPEDIRPISNYINESARYFIPSQDSLRSYKIIVSTLMSSARLLPKTNEEEFFGYGSVDNHLFTHVFIDECGQATEPESLVAMAHLGKPHLHHIGGQLILAGDPQQLGPICSSRNAEKLGLGLSYLERLMSKCPIYQKSLVTGDYDEKYLTKLVLNFRSHPSLLELPNRLFYENDLISNCPKKILNDTTINLPLLRDGKKDYSSNFPIIFHGCIGQEMRDGRSPSFVNHCEIDIVLQYIWKLQQFKIPNNEIGIISPYARQVYRLKEHLRRKNIVDIEVGSTESFQGREKRIIIISTVRSIRNNLAYDVKFKIGFLVDSRRFNVAITRAQSLVIIIGNPHILSLDNNWSTLINFAIDNHSYTGVKYIPRDEEWCEKVTNILKGLSLE